MGVRNHNSCSDPPVRSAEWPLLYLLVRTLVARIIGTSKDGHDDGAKDLEILALRHQLRVLQRTAGRITAQAH